MLAFSKWEEPFKVFSIGHFFVVKKSPTEIFLYKIVNADFMRYIEKGSLAAGAYTSFEDMKALEPHEGEMYGFLIGVRGPVTLKLRQPASVSRWGVKAAPEGEITENDSDYLNPDPATFVVTMKDNTIQRQIKNNLNEEAKYKVKYVGYKYSIIPVAKILNVATGQYLPRTHEVADAIIKEMITLWMRGKLPQVTLEGLGGRG